jgi:hypothetical protein
MKNNIGLLIMITLLFFQQKLFALTILVPEKSVDISVYLNQCQKEGYVCSHDFVSEKLKSADTPKMNRLIETLDIFSDDSRKKLPDDIYAILKTEMISVEQLNTLIQVIDKSLSLEANKKNSFLKKEMNLLSETLNSMNEVASDNTTYIVFKKRLSEKQFFQIKNIIQNFQFYKVDLFSVTEKMTNTIVLLTGDCEHARYAPIIEPPSGSHAQPVFKRECSFSADVQKSMSSVGGFVYEHKTPIILTVIAAGTFMFLKNYDVDFK